MHTSPEPSTLTQGKLDNEVFDSERLEGTRDDDASGIFSGKERTRGTGWYKSLEVNFCAGRRWWRAASR